MNAAAARTHWPTACLTLAIGAVGGYAASRLGLPLPWLLGSLIVTAALAIANLRPLGHVVGAPTGLRLFFIPVIGVSIGAAVTPEIGSDLSRWWPSLLALALFVPIAHALGYTLARRAGISDPPTAYYGTMPGGFIEAIALGDQAGADPALLAVLQFLRLILCIVLIPIGFGLLTGETVGSATGAVIGDTGHALSARDWAILAACGVIGAVGGRAIRMPAGIITGPIIVSGLVHLMGWVEGGPPGWLVNLTQLVIGTTLGARFAGRGPDVLLTGLRVSLVTVGTTLALSGLFSVALAGLVGESWRAVFLAFAPGGLTEMALVALSLDLSVIYVTAHHVIRILLSVAFARLAAGRVLS